MRKVFYKQTQTKSSFCITALIRANPTSVPRFHPHESLFAPTSTPRVLDLPVPWHTTNQQHCMVDRLGAVAKHAGWVARPICCIDCHSDGLINNCWGQGCAWCWYISNATDLKSSSILLACLLFCNIWICGLCCHASCHNIFQSRCWPASVASFVSITCGAVDQLLFWKVNS